MAYIVVGILIWALAGIVIALATGKAIRVADQKQNRERSSQPINSGANTTTLH